MDLTSPVIIQKLCHRYGIYPQKRRGQNFLVNREVLDKIVKAADLKKDDVVLEIGPGFGVLTAELAKRVKKVIAVEADRRLAIALQKILKEYNKGYNNVIVIQEDILKVRYLVRFQTPNQPNQPNQYKIVANLPYQITSAVLRKFLEREPRPSEMIIMVQKEVAERVCARPGEMSMLSVSVQFFGKPEIVEVVPRASFWPEPEVDSAILKISRIKSESEANLKLLTDFNQADAQAVLKKFFRVVKIGFSARRKQLQNNLSAGLRTSNEEIKGILVKLGLDPKIRAQDLSVKDWIRLAVILRKNISFS